MYSIEDGEKDFLPAGQTQLPMLFFLLFLVYACFFIGWVYTCVKKKETVNKLHIIMGALFMFKALKMICASEDTYYVKRTGTPHGWDIAFYVFGFFKGVTMFTVIILIGTGWSFIKPFFAGKREEPINDCNTSTSAGEHCFCCDRRGRPDGEGLDNVEPDFLADRHCLLLCSVFPNHMVDQKPVRGFYHRWKGG